MINQEIIKQIIKAGSLAPSGSNSQPWKFEVKNNIIKVAALPEKDHPILNFRNRGTWIAHGALLENIIIACKNFHIEPKIEIFPEGLNSNIIFLITLNENPAFKDDDNLYPVIFERASNRKRFSTKPLKDEEKNFIFKEALQKNVVLKVVEDREKIKEFAENMAWDTYLNLTNKELHKLFVKEIIWNDKEEKEREGRGLYIKTMEMNPPQIMVMKLLRNYKVVNIFKRIGIIKGIYKDIVKLYSAGCLFGGILVNNEDKDFIEAGRAIENIWIRATKLNLGFHLITGIPFFWQDINLGDIKIFSDEEKGIISQSYRKLENIFNGQNKIIAATFRIGYSKKPSAFSYKREPEIEWFT